MVSDITDETNEGKGRSGDTIFPKLADCGFPAPVALPLISATYSAGAIVGPLIGGLLSHPAERYPNVFGKIGLLRRKVSLLVTSGSVIMLKSRA